MVGGSSHLPFYFSTNMIIDNSKSDIKVVGDIKEFKTSIDPKNLEFITTLLSSNLYSNPEESFIREIVSNAWDSHVEAKTTDKPVIIRFKESYANNSISIRDYGTGLSPERFKEVYCNIGSSTKRESNDFIGGFGIGKYSSLACSNTVYITSYYEGTAYYYVMVKSGNSITTNLLMEKPTKEDNGVDVTIKNIYNLDSYRKALGCIVFFPNIYIDGSSYYYNINHSKIKTFNNFAASSISLHNKILLGNVLYPCNDQLLNKDTRDFLYSIKNIGIVIKFNVGELNITPNRENIIYNANTVSLIEDRVKKAKEELHSIIQSKFGKDYDNIREYYNVMHSGIYYNPITENLDSYNGYLFYPKETKEIFATYKKQDLKEHIYTIRDILNLRLPNFKGSLINDRVYTGKLTFEAISKSLIKSDNIIILEKDTRLMATIKSYIKSKYSDCGIMVNISKSDFKNWVYQNLKIVPKKEIDFIIEGIYEYFTAKATYLNLDTDTEYLKFKDSVIKEKKDSGINKNREAILYTFTAYGYRNKHCFNTLSLAIEYIKNLKSGIILAKMDEDETSLNHIANLKGYKLIKARKDIIEDLKKLNLKCVVDTSYLIKKDPILYKVSAIRKVFKDGINADAAKKLIQSLPDGYLIKEFINILNVYQTYALDRTYIGLSLDITPDKNTEKLCIKFKEYIDKYNSAVRIIDNNSITSSKDLVSAVLLKTKSYRINSKYYNSYKNNNLIKVLCKK